MDNPHFIVSVRCFTYNHSKYIEDTLDGFAMQQTNFPFVCIVMDDDSQDGEPEVIKHYFEQNFNFDDDSVVRNEENDDYVMTFAQHKENKNCYFAVYYLKYNHYKKKAKLPYFSHLEERVKYIAMCEGDDYWIYPYKLQKQVNFMENHPNYSMCCHNAIIRDEDIHEVYGFNKSYESGDLPIKDLITSWKIPTASILCHKDASVRPTWLINTFNGDYSLILGCILYGKIYYIGDVMSVYRLNSDNGSATSRSKGQYSMLLQQKVLLLESYKEGTSTRFDFILTDYICYLKKEYKSL